MYWRSGDSPFRLPVKGKTKRKGQEEEEMDVVNRQEFKAQSRHWANFVVIGQGVSLAEGEVRNVRLSERKAGLLTEYTVEPDGDWSGIRLDWEGKISQSKKSTGKVIEAMACSSNFSGGGNYHGWVFGQLGGLVWLTDGGIQKWIAFEEGGPKMHDVAPWKKARELWVVRF